MVQVKLLVIAATFLCIYSQKVDVKCTQAFCEEYIGKNPCKSIPDVCEIQNATYNGLFLPSPSPCNCCKYCLGNLNEGNSCTVGSPASPTPSSICGNSLSCNADDSTCQRMNTDCIKAQDEYDRKKEAGELGHLEVRPECDRYGQYQPYKCVPGESCYCLSPKGKRIFGEIPYTPLAAFLLKCKCSRDFETASNVIGRPLHSDEFLRCQADGDYDTIQCIGDGCLCVDPSDGSPTYPKADLINITLISNSSLNCFDFDQHEEGRYYRKCEELYREKLKEVEKQESLGYEVFSVSYPNCQLDGYFGPVQDNDTHNFCADHNGKLLENFFVLKTNPLAENMSCKCARTRSIMNAEEKPICCENGNYQKMQCRRGLCRCVDGDGSQIEKEVDYEDREKLTCFQNLCPESPY